MGGGRNDEGWVEINIGIGWGIVCDDEWDLCEVIVVCNMFGFIG